MKYAHPKGLFSLSHVELCTGFVSFALLSLLVLYLIHQLHLPSAEAYRYYGVLISLTYTMPVLGGYYCDHFISKRAGVTLGVVLLVIGNFILADPEPIALPLGLTFFVTGLGFVKPNTMSIVGDLYTHDHHHKEIGFTLFYALLNIGAIAGPVVLGIVGHLKGWSIAFTINGAVMFTGLLVFLLHYGRYYSDTPRVVKRYPLSTWFVTIVSLAVIMALEYGLFRESWLYRGVLLISTILVVIGLVIVGAKQRKKQRLHLLGLIILILAALIFFSAELQFGSSLIVFVSQAVPRTIFGVTIPAPVFVGLLPLFVATGAVTMSPFYKRLKKHMRAGRYLHRCIVGLLLGAFGFLIFAISSLPTVITVPGLAIVGLILGNFFLGNGEVTIAPIINAAITELAPQKLQSTFMGVYYFAMALSGYFAALLASAADWLGPHGHHNPYHFTTTFIIILCVLLFFAFVGFAIKPWLTRLINA